MKSLNYTLVIMLSILIAALPTGAQNIVGESDLFTFDTRFTLVSGIVTDADNDNPIQGANITLTGGNAFTATSAANGSYSLDSVPAGNYNLFVFKTNYEEYSEDVVISGDPAQTIDVSLTPGEGNYVPINSEMTAFADNIVQSPANKFTLSGNAHINNVLHFDGEIVIDKRPSLNKPEISGSCKFYATNIKYEGPTCWIKNNNIAFVYEADGSSLVPTEWAYLLDGSFAIGGFNITVGEIILDPAFDFLEIKAIAQMPYPINKVTESYYESGEVSFFVEEMSGSVILSKTNGKQMAVAVSGLNVNVGVVAFNDVEFYYNSNTEIFGGALTIKIPGSDPDEKSSFINTEAEQLPVELRNKGGQLIGNMSLGQFMDTYRGNDDGFELEFRVEIGFVSGAIDKLIITFQTAIPIGATGLEISQISGGVYDLTTEQMKIFANVDIDMKIQVNGESPVSIDSFGLLIQPWETFRGSGQFMVFGWPVSDGYIEYNRPLNALSAECNLDLFEILIGHTEMNFIGGQLNGSGKLTLKTPNLSGWLSFAGNKTIGTAQSEFNNQYFSSNFKIGKRYGWPINKTVSFSLASKLVFGYGNPNHFPWFHFYVGRNLNKLHKIWKGEINGMQAETFVVTENAWQLLVVAMDTLNPTLFDFSLEDPSGQIFNKDTAYYYDYYEDGNTTKQTIMAELKPMAGEWKFMTDYEGQVDVHFAITNQEPTFLVSEPSQRRSRSNDISLAFTDYDDTLNVKVYYNTNNQHFNGRMIDKFRIINNGNLDFVWHNEDVPNGEYYIYCGIDDGYNASYFQYAPGSIWVENQAGIEIPQNLKVEQEDETFVVNWNGPESDNIVAATVYYRNISSGRVMDETVYDTTAAILRDLKPGQEYVLWARFIDKNGAFSEPSEKINQIFMSEDRNNPPYFTLVADSVFFFVEDQQDQYILKANDADGDGLTYAIPGDTLGITLNNDEITWTPEEGHRGGYDLKVTVTDGYYVDTTCLRLIVYTEDQVSVDLAFSSVNLYERDNMFVKINNYFCPFPNQQLTLKNTRTLEETTVATRRVDDFQYIGNFGLSYIDRSDIFVERGDTIEAKYTYQSEEHFAYAYYDTLPQPSDNIPPGTISDLSIERLPNNSIYLNWTATGNDHDLGTAYRYDIRYAYEPINTEDIYYTAHRILTCPYPSQPGEQDSLLINLMDLDDITAHENVYFSIKAEDEMQNRGGLSNSPGTHCSLNPTNISAVVEDIYYVALDWDGPLPGKQTAGLQHYDVFRKIDQGEFSLLESGVGQTDYTDDLKDYPDGTYQYAIQAIYDTESSDIVYTPAILMERFVNVSLLLSLQDTNNYQGIVYDINGLDDVYSQEFSGTTNATGLEVFDNVYYGLYEITASKENYVALLDTISVSKDHHSFNLVLANNLGNIDIPAGKSQFFKIYPNPNEGAFTLELFAADALSGIQVEIYSLLGDKLMQVELEGQLIYDFNLSNAPRGIYLIRVVKGKEEGFTKLIRK